MKYEISNAIPSLLDFVIKERPDLPKIKFVELDVTMSVVPDILHRINIVDVSLRPRISDSEIIRNVYGPIAELKSLLQKDGGLDYD